jgi:hypothetical protein
LQSFVTKLLNLEKIHAIIEGNESYEGFDEDEKEHVPQLTEQTRDLIGRAYVISYLEAVYNYDPNVDFVTQCEQGFKDLIKSSMGFVTMMAAIGFNVLPKDEEGFKAVVNKHLTDEEFSNIAKELNEVVKKADKEIEAKLKEMKEDADTSGN